MTARMEDLCGSWSGSSRLWLSPDEDPVESSSTADVMTICQGQFIRIAYTWEYDGKPQDGLIIFGNERDGTSVWLDSWHMARQIMVCETSNDGNSVVSVRGSYAAPPGPDWGWRIEIEHREVNTFLLRMFNITTDGREELAVRAEYGRA